MHTKSKDVQIFDTTIAAIFLCFSKSKIIVNSKFCFLLTHYLIKTMSPQIIHCTVYCLGKLQSKIKLRINTNLNTGVEALIEF